MRFGIDLSGPHDLTGASTLRPLTWTFFGDGIRSHGLVWLSVLTRAFLMTFLVTAFRCPQVADVLTSQFVGSPSQSQAGLRLRPSSSGRGEQRHSGALGVFKVTLLPTHAGEE
jgi:hypothetical protein